MITMTCFVICLCCDIVVLSKILRMSLYCTDWSQEEDAEYRRLMKDIGDSDSDADSKLSTQVCDLMLEIQFIPELLINDIRV